MGMQNRTLGPYLAAINRILISVMRVSRLAAVDAPQGGCRGGAGLCKESLSL
jgi:hypothetical protein